MLLTISPHSLKKKENYLVYINWILSSILRKDFSFAYFSFRLLNNFSKIPVLNPARVLLHTVPCDMVVMITCVIYTYLDRKRGVHVITNIWNHHSLLFHFYSILVQFSYRHQLNQTTKLIAYILMFCWIKINKETGF